MAKSGTQIYAFFGSDEGKVKEAAFRLSQKIAPKDDEFGLEIVSGGADNAEHATRIIGSTIEAIQTLPFFGGDKVVWLQGATFFGDTQTGKAESVLRSVDALSDLLAAGLPSDVKLIISASEVDKRRSFYKKISKLGDVKVFDKVDIRKADWASKMVPDVKAMAQEMNLELSSHVAELFIMRIGPDSRQLRSELEKLSLFIGDRAASEQDVRDISATSNSGVIFEIGEALSRRNLPLAQELIEQQLKRGENAVGILLAAIVPKIRNLLHAHDLMSRHGVRAFNYKQFQSDIERLPASETAHLPKAKTGGLNVYPLFMTVKSSGKFSVDELRAALDACLEANLRLVTTGLDPALVLNQLVARVLAASPTRR